MVILLWFSSLNLCFDLQKKENLDTFPVETEASSLHSLNNSDIVVSHIDVVLQDVLVFGNFRTVQTLVEQRPLFGSGVVPLTTFLKHKTVLIALLLNNT